LRDGGVGDGASVLGGVDSAEVELGSRGLETEGEDCTRDGALSDERVEELGIILSVSCMEGGRRTHGIASDVGDGRKGKSKDAILGTPEQLSRLIVDGSERYGRIEVREWILRR
jgi:hypothetical protein